MLGAPYTCNKKPTSQVAGDLAGASSTFSPYPSTIICESACSRLSCRVYVNGNQAGFHETQIQYIYSTVFFFWKLNSRLYILLSFCFWHPFLWIKWFSWWCFWQLIQDFPWQLPVSIWNHNMSSVANSIIPNRFRCCATHIPWCAHGWEFRLTWTFGSSGPRAAKKIHVSAKTRQFHVIARPKFGLTWTLPDA